MKQPLSSKAKTAQLDGPAKLWGSRMFTPNACNSCVDTFALCADLVVMASRICKGLQRAYSRNCKNKM